MTTFIYGTGNAGKIQFMQEVFSPLDFRLMGIGDFSLSLPDVDESGNSPLENARIKALAYYQALCNHTEFDYPLFSCDSGLYLEGLSEKEQPGVHVRRVGGKNLTDEEMINYYASVAESLGGKVTARYRNAICLVMNANEIYEYMGEDIASAEFLLVSKPHPKLESGFPLNSLSVDIDSGRYYNDLNIKPRNNSQEGFREFFRRVSMQHSMIRHYGALIDGSYIKIATESDLHYILDIDPFRRVDSIRHAIMRGDCYMAVYDGIIKGFAIMNYTFFDNAFIELLMVEEKYRQCGIGSALLNYLFDKCKTPKLFTSTNRSNEPMRKLLGKSGFTFCGEIDALDEGDPELFFVRQKAV